MQIASIGDDVTRSPKRKPKSKLTVLVQTHVTPEVGRMVDERIRQTGDKEAAYVRRLIHRDLGLSKDDQP